MRPYETIFILDAALDGDTVEAEIGKVTALIEEKQGTIVDVQRWGRRRLAYAIKKKTEGVYTYIRFDSDTEVLGELDRRYGLNENVLRHLTVRVEHPEASSPKSPEEAGEAREAAAAASRAPARVPEGEEAKAEAKAEAPTEEAAAPAEAAEETPAAAEKD